MSGLFKSFDKFVSTQVLAGAHRLLLNPASQRFNSANLYYDPRLRFDGLKQGHSYNCFSLAVMSQALVQESQLFQTIKQSQEIQDEVSLNNNLALNCLQNAISLIKEGRWSGETETLAALIYSLENLENQIDNKRTQFYQNYICPQILNNISYLSTLNIIDITEGLTKANYFDQKFWGAFIDGIKNKSFSWQYESVEQTGWTVTQYEYKAQCKRCPYFSNTQSVFKYYQNGGKSFLNDTKKLIQDAVIHAYAQIWLPFAQREKRVRYLFNERDASTHKATFRNALDLVAQNVPETKDSIDQIVKKI